MLQWLPLPAPKMQFLSTFSLLFVGALSDTDLTVNMLGKMRRRPEGAADPTVMGTWQTVAAPLPVWDDWLLAALIPTLQPP